MNLLPQFYKFKTLAAYAYNISLSYTSIILYFSLSYIKQARMIIMSSKLTLRIGQNWEKIKGQKRYKHSPTTNLYFWITLFESKWHQIITYNLDTSHY